MDAKRAILAGPAGQRLYGGTNAPGSGGTLTGLFLAAAEAVAGGAMSTPGVAQAITLNQRTLNMGKILQFYDWAAAGRYERFIRNTFLSNTTPSQNDIQIVANDHDDSDQVLTGTYEILCYLDGDMDSTPVVVASVAGTGANRVTANNVNLNAIPNGWHVFDLRRTVADGSIAVPYWMYVGAYVTPVFAPTQTGSFGITHEDYGVAKWGKVPIALDPPALPPLTYREATPFATAVNARELYRRNLSPTSNGDLPYLRTVAHPTTGEAIPTCLNVHGYNFNVFAAELPQVVLRDGPRGVGLLSGPTHLDFGRTDPIDPTRLGHVYFADPWSLGKIYNDGRIERQVGYRQTANGGLELLGDWSAIPEARRGFHLIWGAAWWLRTISADHLDTSRTVDRGDGFFENPHLPSPELNFTGPVQFVTDSLSLNVNGRPGRVCKVQYSADDHDAVPVVTEFVADSHNAWDVVCDPVEDIIYVSERRDHRIVAYSAVTGAYIRTILETADGDSYAYVSDDDRPTALQPLANIRAQDCVLPEGLFLQDGWLYFGSIVMRQVKRIDMATLDNPGGPTVEVVADLSGMDSKTEYCKIALGDGTFGPRNTVAVAAWEKEKNSVPWFFLPGGTPWNVHVPGSNANEFGRADDGHASEGYTTAVAIRNGRMVFGTADYGLIEMTLAVEGDELLNESTYAAGKSQYELAGYRLTHGIAGMRQWQSVELPWGMSAAVDYYLTQNGHTPP